MQGMSSQQDRGRPLDPSIGRIVSVTGLEGDRPARRRQQSRHSSLGDRPEMGTLLAIDTAKTTVLAIVSALSVPVPSHREGDTEDLDCRAGSRRRAVEGSDTGQPRSSTAASPFTPRSAIASASP